MKKTFGGLFGAVMIAVASLQTHAQGLVYDQQSATSPTSPAANDFLNIQEDSPLLQSFMPTLSTIGFVQFQFWDILNNGTNGATVYVKLWTGSPNINSATLLGSTAPVYMPNGFVNDGLGFAGIANFSFSTPVTLTAGQTYYLQPVVLSGDDPWDIGVLTYDAYSNGQLFSNGLPGSTIDLWFREGVVSVPEPTAFALIGLSGLLFFGRSALPGKCFFNSGCALRIRRFQSVKQSVGTGFKKLRQAGKYCQRNRKRAAFNVSDRFPMHAYQLSQTFLSHIGFVPRVADMLAKQP